jgi:prepilin-type N-terminal cleavage/methylation domain-containing protein
MFFGRIKMKLFSKNALFRSYRAGFTLIELLVVISIIALLSSVILAALNGARNKGQTASVIEFTDNNYHKLGANTLFSVNFNEGPGLAVPIDSTGNFSVYPSGTMISHSTNSFSGSGYSFDNTSTGGYGSTLKFTSSNSIQFQDTSGMTESVWFNLNATTFPTSGGLLGTSVVYTGNPGSVSGIYFTSSPQKGIDCLLGTQNSANSFYFSPDANWHNVTCTYDGTNVYIYFDGKLVLGPVVGTDGAVTSFYSVPTTITIGAGFIGYVDNAQIFAGSLLATDVQKLYAEGLKTHELAAR